jgi:hypothetical protein
MPSPTDNSVIFWHNMNLAQWTWLQTPRTLRDWSTEAMRIANLCNHIKENGFSQVLAKDGLRKNAKGYAILPMDQLERLGLTKEAEGKYI